MHAIVCAGVAAVLEGGYPDQRLLSERELRREEIDLSAPLASARLPDGPPGARRVHRPDLALCPRDRDGGLPVAVEVELTIKAPRRLATICRAWSRTRNVSGVIYVAPPDVQRALQRAIDTVQGEARIVVVPLHALADGLESMGTPPMGTIPIDA
jgi:hypothetical protein